MSIYDNVILKAKQVICLESLYLKKDSLAVLPTGYDLHVQNYPANRVSFDQERSKRLC